MYNIFQFICDKFSYNQNNLDKKIVKSIFFKFLFIKYINLIIINIKNSIIILSCVSKKDDCRLWFNYKIEKNPYF